MANANTTFRPGDKVITNCPSYADTPVAGVYVTFYRNVHWVLIDSADMAFFSNFSKEDLEIDMDGLALFPCTSVKPLPTVVTDIPWSMLPDNTEIIVDYTTPAWFACYFPARQANTIGVYVDIDNNFVPKDKATHLYFLSEQKCALPANTE